MNESKYRKNIPCSIANIATFNNSPNRAFFVKNGQIHKAKKLFVFNSVLCELYFSPITTDYGWFYHFAH